MDSKDLHNLSEAWNNITSSQQIDEGIADDPRWGVLGQAERLRRKMFGTQPEVNQAVSYERSIDALTKSRGGGNVRLGADGKPITAAQISAATRERRLADPNYKPGQGVDSGTKPTLGRGGPGPGTGTGGPGSGSTLFKAQPTLSPQQIANQKANAAYQALRTKDPAAAKAQGMDAWAKANPKLAAAAAERARTRGTSATTNPLMADMKSRLPAPAPIPSATAAATPITNRVATAYGSGAQPIAPIRPLAVTPIRPVAPVVPVNKTKTAYTPGLRLQHVDLFDIVKGHLLDEGATEEEALKRMAVMTEEERNEILESCGMEHGGKKKKDKKKSGY